MELHSLYEVETDSQRFTMTIHGRQGKPWVARYWNQPHPQDPRHGRQFVARIVGGSSVACQQLCGEVLAKDAESAIRSARQQIEHIDGPIRIFTRSKLYGPDAGQRRLAAAES